MEILFAGMFVCVVGAISVGLWCWFDKLLNEKDNNKGVNK